MFASLSTSYATALASCAGVLAIKIGALNLLTVRSRLLTGDFGSGKEGGVSQPADMNMAGWTVMIFKLALGAVGPTFSTQKLVQLVNNAKENEPWFLGLATAIAVAGTAPTWGATALYTYTASRFAHGILFLFDFPEQLLPYQVLIRATPYLIGVFTMFSLSGSQLM